MSLRLLGGVGSTPGFACCREWRRIQSKGSALAPIAWVSFSGQESTGKGKDFTNRGEIFCSPQIRKPAHVLQERGGDPASLVRESKWGNAREVEESVGGVVMQDPEGFSCLRRIARSQKGTSVEWGLAAWGENVNRSCGGEIREFPRKDPVCAPRAKDLRFARLRS